MWLSVLSLEISRIEDQNPIAIYPHVHNMIRGDGLGHLSQSLPIYMFLCKVNYCGLKGKINFHAQYFLARKRMNLSLPLPTLPDGDTQISQATAGDTQAHAKLPQKSFITGCAQSCLTVCVETSTLVFEGFVQRLVGKNADDCFNSFEGKVPEDSSSIPF